MRPFNKFLKAGIILALGLLLLVLFSLYFHFLRPPSQVVAGRAALHLKFAQHADGVWSIRFSPNGETLASGSIDGTAKIWRVNDGQVVHNLKHPQGVSAVAFSPNGQYLATASYDSQVRLWQTEDGKLVKSFPGHSQTVWFVAFSPDGYTLASSGEDRTVKLWNVVEGTLARTLTGHDLNVWSVAFSPDGKQLASSSFDKTIKIWDLANGRQLRTINGHSEAVLEIVFSGHGTFLASCGDDSTVKLWDTRNWSLIQTFSEGLEHTYACGLSPDGKQILSGSRDRSTFGKLLQSLLGETERNKGVTVRLWNVADGSLIQSFADHANEVHSVAFSPDGKSIAAAGMDKRVVVWRLAQ